MNDSKVEILIVDDMPENLDLLGRVLEMAEFMVRPATGGQAALQTAQAQPPDLILLDITMPVMDGFETCRRLKADPTTQDIPVIFLTGEGESSFLSSPKRYARPERSRTIHGKGLSCQTR